MTAAAVGNGVPVRNGDRRLRIAIAVISLIGIAVATYLTYTHYAGLNVVCPVSGGCETVQKSVYSKLDGIPVAVLGLAGYIWILISLAIRNELRASRRLRHRPDRLPVQPLPHLPRDLHDQGDLPLVREQRGDDDAPDHPHRDPARPGRPGRAAATRVKTFARAERRRIERKQAARH